MNKLALASISMMMGISLMAQTTKKPTTTTATKPAVSSQNQVHNLHWPLKTEPIVPVMHWEFALPKT